MEQQDRQAVVDALQQAVAHLRDAQYYSSLRARLKISSDQERIELLADFATSEQQLARLRPSVSPDSPLGFIWTTTITTTIIFWPSTAEAPTLPPKGDFPIPDPGGPKPA